MRLSTRTLAALAILTACGGGTTSPTLIPSGSASFTFTGAGGGTFAATGSASDAATTRTYAVAYTNSQDNSIDIQAVQATSASLSNVLTIVFKGQAAGTGTVASGCVATSTVACNTIAFVIGTPGGSSSSFQCFVTSGSITVATVSGATATGTFSGSGNCIANTGVSSAFTLTGGTFSAPLTPTTPATL